MTNMPDSRIIREEKINVTPITSGKVFFDMGSEWNSLLKKSKSETIFLTWEWLSSWWKVYGAGKDLYILRIERKKTLIGLAPFYICKVKKLSLPLRAVYLIGDGSYDSDYLDIISSEGEEEFVVNAIFDHLANSSKDWELLFINEIPQTSPNLPLIIKKINEKKWHLETSEVECAYMYLPSDWDTYLKSLKPRMRTKIRSLIKRLESVFDIKFDLCKKENDLEERLFSLYDLHHKRWQKEGQEGVFLFPNKQLFYGEISRLFLCKGWLRFYSLSSESEFLAHQFCFEYEKQVYLLQEGFNPELVKYGVGNVLRAYVFQHCIKQGVGVYDFLAGVTTHKLSWGAQTKKSVRITTATPKLKTSFLFALDNVLEIVKKGVRLLLPASVFYRIRNVFK